MSSLGARADQRSNAQATDSRREFPTRSVQWIRIESNVKPAYANNGRNGDTTPALSAEDAGLGTPWRWCAIPVGKPSPAWRAAPRVQGDRVKRLELLPSRAKGAELVDRGAR